jgi:DNA gyrase subunit B
MAKGLRGLQIQRYKGLGEMPTLTLKEEVMEKEQTRLKLDSIQEKIEEANQVCSDLMGENVAARRQFIEENATYAELDS